MALSTKTRKAMSVSRRATILPGECMPTFVIHALTCEPAHFALASLDDQVYRQLAGDVHELARRDSFPHEKLCLKFQDLFTGCACWSDCKATARRSDGSLPLA